MLKLIDKLKNLQEYLLIKHSGLFDSYYYYRHYPDVRQADRNPLMHYIYCGWKEGRNPSEAFDTNFYLSQNQDVRDANVNPLIHYIKFGMKERRKIADPDLDVKNSAIAIIQTNMSLLTPEELSLISLLKKFNFFDPTWYMAQNLDIQKSGEDPWVHFICKGINENRKPNRFFDPIWYMDFYRDVNFSEINPLEHYLKYGRDEHRKPYNTVIINILAVEHCTNSCEFCSTSSPFAKKVFHAASSFFPGLDLLENEHIPFECISITGGEPFLHPDIGSLVYDLKNRYPMKKIGVVSNFFWANERSIEKLAPIIKLFDHSLDISTYPNLIDRLGGMKQFNGLVDRLRDLCPETDINVINRDRFTSWELHTDRREVENMCGTSECFLLRADGKISRCPVGAGLEDRPEYSRIINNSRELLFDLNKGIEGFSSWSLKYPFDLCFHCTMWRNISVPWRAIDRHVL